MESNVTESVENKTSKSTEELLTEILKYQKRGSRITRIASFAVIAIVVAIAVCLVLLMPKIVGFVDHAETSLSQLDGVISETSSMMDEVNGLITEAGTLIDNSNKMVSENTDAVSETVQKLNNIDFETLNKAINELHDVVEPLSNFFGKFSR